MNLDIQTTPDYFLDVNYADEVIVPSDDPFSYVDGWIEPYQQRAQEIYDAYMKKNFIEIPNEFDLIQMDNQVFDSYCINPDEEWQADWIVEDEEFVQGTIDFCNSEL